jgi:hypothetical protein
MNKKITLAMTSLLSVPLASAADKPIIPLKVFVVAAQVQERKEVDDATKNALKAKRDAARDARKAKEEQLKSQYGKKRENWPADKQEELYGLEEAAALAEADYEYRKIETKGLNDAVKDVVNSIQGKGITAGRKHRVLLASSGAEADLVVEIQARRSGKTLPTQFKPDRCFLLFTLGPGGKLDPRRFAEVPQDYRPGKFLYPVWRLASPKPGRPVFTFESYNGGGNEFGCQGAAANAASVAVDKFIEDNADILTAAK